MPHRRLNIGFQTLFRGQLHKIILFGLVFACYILLVGESNQVFVGA